MMREIDEKLRAIEAEIEELSAKTDDYAADVRVKELKSEKHIDDPVLIYTYEEDYNKLKEQNFKNRDDAKYKKVEDAIGKIVEFNIKEGKKNTEILLIGRYGFDGYKINSV